MDMTYDDVVSCLRKAGLWFPVLLLLWMFIYAINAGAWYAIICNGLNGVKVSFMKKYIPIIQATTNILIIIT